MGFYIFITENSTNVVATHVALSLPVVTVKEKSYNPVCWLSSLAED